MRPAIRHVLTAKTKDIGGLSVRRALPDAHVARVGPFVFWDEMGSVDYPPGQGLDVRPHPHIGLATVTYLFSGAMVHRDSLGTVQAIRPGEVNLMVAGRGIVHSERSEPQARASGHRLHGIQSWLALPDGWEECDPAFHHTTAAELPVARPEEGVTLRVLMGEIGQWRSPVPTFSETVYAEITLADGGAYELPHRDMERAVYVVGGRLLIAGRSFDAGALVVLVPGAPVEIETQIGTRVMLLGGRRISGERILWWNFLAREPGRIEAAQRAWESAAAQGFVDSVFTLPPEESEHIPLPMG